MEWINVKDRLPKKKDLKEGRCLAIDNTKGYCPYVTHYAYKNFGLASVTHWMPLPEPPKK